MGKPEIIISNNSFPEEEYFRLHEEYQKICDFNRALEIVAPILEARYSECDSSPEKHLEPNKETEVCDYCCRNLNYKTPKLDSILEERAKLPWYHQPMDASLLRDLRDREINSQKSIDWFKGIIKLIQELNL